MDLKRNCRKMRYTSLINGLKLHNILKLKHIVLVALSAIVMGCMNQAGVNNAPIYRGGYLSNERGVPEVPHNESDKAITPIHIEEVQSNTYEYYDGPTHVVRRGETLFAIAKRYEIDYRDLARDNNLTPPYQIKVGNILRLPADANLTSETNTIAVAPPAIVEKPKAAATRRVANITWQWPIAGQIVEKFNQSTNNYGIVIKVAQQVDNILAAADGVVTYAGEHLTEYGKLIIIDHGNNLISVYGNNDDILVQQQAQVKRGENIAIVESGKSIHFEIRKNGIPVDPINYLPQ